MWKTTTIFGDSEVQGDEPGTYAATFTDAMGSDDVLLMPGHWLVVEAVPWNVKWTYDPAFSTAWGFIDLTIDTFKEEAPDLIADNVFNRPCCAATL